MKKHNIILISHGPLAEAFIASASMLYGTKDNVVAFTLGANDSIENFEKMINNYIADNLCNDTLILCDIAGGSPFNCAYKAKLLYGNVEVVSGMNMGMVLEVFLSEENCSLIDLVNCALEAGKQCVSFLNTEIIDELDEIDKEIGD